GAFPVAATRQIATHLETAARLGRVVRRSSTPATVLARVFFGLGRTVQGAGSTLGRHPFGFGHTLLLGRCGRSHARSCSCSFTLLLGSQIGLLTLPQLPHATLFGGTRSNLFGAEEGTC